MVSGLAASLGAEVPVQDVVLRGKVVTLAAALDAKKLGIRVDAEPTASTVVLLSEDGTITPLLSDEASRALFLDKRLQNRPAELRGKRFGGVPYLRPTLQHATAALIIPDRASYQCMQKMR